MESCITKDRSGMWIHVETVCVSLVISSVRQKCVLLLSVMVILAIMYLLVNAVLLV